MQYSTIRNTNINVSRISFGTASLHHLLSSKKRILLLEKALSLGITHFDTSPYYGYGLSEIDVGKFSKRQRNEITITTKVGLYPPNNSSCNSFSIFTRKTLGKLYTKISKPEVDWSIEVAKQSLESSLNRLNTDHVDFLFLHEPNMAIIQTDEYMKWTEELVKHGKIRHYGLAGLPDLIKPWIDKSHSMCQIIQTRDSFSDNEVFNSFLKKGYEPQFTYGLFSQVSKSQRINHPEKILNNALDRNSSGSIIISTRKLSRLEELTNIFLDEKH